MHRDVTALGVAADPWHRYVMPDPANAGDRAKAYRLRKLMKTTKVPAVDALWLAEYDEKQEARRKARAPVDVGGSRRQARRRVKLDIEEDEEAEAVGTGSAAAAAAMALQVKEEGRRLDSLTVESVGALKEAVGVYRDVCLTLRRQWQTMQEMHMEMLGTVREQYLARTQAEIEALQATQGEGDSISKVAEAVLPHVLQGLNGKGKPAA